jgi:hypothetical protein
MLQQKIMKRALKNNSMGNDRVQDRVPKHDLTIILGNMNVKLGKEKAFSQVVGRHTLHNISNKNG